MRGTDPSATQPTAEPRLELKLIMGEAALDGAWWPRSRDLSQELPTLADHWPARIGYIARVLYSAPDWDTAPRRIFSCGAIIPVSAFPDEDTHKVILTLSGSRRRIELLVIPPDTSPEGAALASAVAVGAGNRHTATQILQGLAHWTTTHGAA